MYTTIYFVRHAQSEFIEGKEYERGLTSEGERDTLIVERLLKDIPFDAAYSSPFKRAIDTIKSIINYQGLVLSIKHNLREREIGKFGTILFHEAKEKLYSDFTISFPHGESGNDAQKRAISDLLEIVHVHNGKTVLLGLHGDIFTLMLNYFDNHYHYDFWQSLTMPDIYKVTFESDKLINVERIWSPSID